MLWKVNQVAEYLNVSKSWVYHQAEAGTLPCIRIQGHLRFDPVEIKDFVRRSSCPSKVAPLFS